MENVDCLFCRIVSGTVPAKKCFETNQVLAFEDIDPQAPIHMLLIHKTHTCNLTETDGNVLGELFEGVRQLVNHLQLSDYRMVVNTGEKAGQSVFHTHVHILAGRPFSWPPG